MHINKPVIKIEPPVRLALPKRESLTHALGPPQPKKPKGHLIQDK
ncbi:hypothetical protein oki361_25190 [Helicobacter pylori]|jgi:hypothetical protein